MPWCTAPSASRPRGSPAMPVRQRRFRMPATATSRTFRAIGSALAAASLAASALVVQATPVGAVALPRLIVSEADANGSSQSYAGDWFELTNLGTSAVSLTGYSMDDD